MQTLGLFDSVNISNSNTSRVIRYDINFYFGHVILSKMRFGHFLLSVMTEVRKLYLSVSSIAILLYIHAFLFCSLDGPYI